MRLLSFLLFCLFFEKLLAPSIEFEECRFRLQIQRLMLQRLCCSAEPAVYRDIEMAALLHGYIAIDIAVDRRLSESVDYL
jgi:hypothetical protein